MIKLRFALQWSEPQGRDGGEHKRLKEWPWVNNHWAGVCYSSLSTFCISLKFSQED